MARFAGPSNTQVNMHSIKGLWLKLILNILADVRNAAVGTATIGRAGIAKSAIGLSPRSLAYSMAGA